MLMKDFEMLRRVYFFARRYKWPFLFSYIILLLELISGQMLPIFLADVINSAVYHPDVGHFLGATTNYSVIFILYTTCGFCQLQLWQRLNNSYVYDIRVACYRKILHLKPRILGDIQTGDFIKIINNDTAEFHHIIQRFGMRIFNAGITTVVSLTIVANIKWEIALAIMAVIPVSALVSRKIEIKMQKASREVRQRQGEYAAWTMEILKGLREIKLFVAERNVLRQFVKKNHDVVKLEVEQEYIQFYANEIINGIYFCINILFYGVSALFVANSDINVGEYIAISTYFAMITNNIKRVLHGNIDYQRRKTCIERVLRLLDEEDEDESGLIELKADKGKIEIHDLSFAYETENYVLKNLNLQINSGEKVGVVGESGVGKSTFANLLLKFYEAQLGDISIDGRKLRDCKYSSIREAIGIVRQENVVFHSTVRENITFGALVSDGIIWDILEKVYLKDEIEQLPDGLDSVLGEKEISLSGGQCQRLCIARLFLRNPKIIILDEATSALDRQSEKNVQKALDALMEGKTAIIITHQYNRLLNADKILVLHEGRQVGYDSYAKLQAENPYFIHLLEAQEGIA